MIYMSNSLEETTEIARKFLTSIVPENESTTVAFYGDLGAGKQHLYKLLQKKWV